MSAPPTSRRNWLFVIVGVILFLLVVLSIGIGPVYLSPGKVLNVLLGNVPQESSDYAIIWNLRLPRIFLAMVVGAGLGTAGAGYQGMFRNPLADPFVIGASSGAAVGAAIAIVFFWGQTGFSWTIPACALIGSMVSVSVVYGIASVGGRIPTVSLLLAGIAVGSILSSIVSLMMFINEEKLATITGWLMGSFSTRGWEHLWPTLGLVGFGIAGLWLMSRGLDALTFGEESARTLGFKMGQIRVMVIFLATLTTAAAVSAGGIIGFIGLIAPHVARMLFGARHARVIPASALMGAILLLLADDVSRSLVENRELPVGVISALMGAPFFLYLLKTRQHSLDGDPN